MTKLNDFLKTKVGQKHYKGDIISIIKDSEEHNIGSNQDKMDELSHLIGIVMEDYNSNIFEPNNINKSDIDKYISNNIDKNDINIKELREDETTKKLLYIGFNTIFSSKLPVALYLDKVLEFLKIYKKHKKLTTIKRLN